MLVSKEASCAQGHAAQAAKTWAATFCSASLVPGLPFCKKCYALPRSWPPLFSPLLAEAFLLTGALISDLEVFKNSVIARNKATSAR